MLRRFQVLQGSLKNRKLTTCHCKRLSFNSRARWIRWFCLAAVIASITGCVYLRLLDFKNQLAKFDQNFSVEAKDDFTLLCKVPVLYRDDFDYLAKLEPSRTKFRAREVQTFYAFEKINIEGIVIKPPVELEITLTFNESDLLTSITYSPIFLAMVPADFLEASLRSLGSSTVNRSKRQIRADLIKVDKLAGIPTKTDIETVLGIPLQTIPRENAERLLYRFKLKTTKVEEGYEERQFTSVKLDFDLKTQKLLRMSGRFAGLKLAVDYRKFREKDN